MKTLAAFLSCLLTLAISWAALAQELGALGDNPLAADLPFVIPQVAFGDASRGGGEFMNRGNRAVGRDSGQFGLHYRLNMSRSSLPGARQGARQTTFSYLPHYSRRPALGLANQNKPALAPLPVTYSPPADPFYKERMLERILGDGSGFYP